MPQTAMFPGQALAMTGQAADRLLKLDSGDAALLYLHLLRRGGLGLAMGLAALLYFAGLLTNLDQGLDWLRFVTPYYYADAARVFSGEAEALPVLTGCALGLGGCALGLWWYGRKDIAA